MQVKRIKFERTGGFAGIRMAADIKLEDLPEDQAHTISELLDDMDFQELPANMMGKSNMPDQFTYTITVQTRKWEHTVVAGESSAPEKMQELIQLLNRLARTQKRQ
jgi:hypothetical protein